MMAHRNSTNAQNHLHTGDLFVLYTSMLTMIHSTLDPALLRSFHTEAPLFVLGPCTSHVKQTVEGIADYLAGSTCRKKTCNKTC